jgi:hypothetical protein
MGLDGRSRPSDCANTEGVLFSKILKLKQWFLKKNKENLMKLSIMPWI